MDLAFVFASLEDALDDTHRQANRMFFSQRFVSYGDLRAREEAVRSCLRILEPYRPTDKVPAVEHHGSSVAGRFKQRDGVGQKLADVV